MAIIQCPECRNEVSDTAEMCPNCGFAVKKYFNKEKRKQLQYEAEEKLKQLQIENDEKSIQRKAERSARINIACDNLNIKFKKFASKFNIVFKKWGKIVLPCIAGIILLSIIIPKLLIPEIDYYKANKAFNKQDYMGASSIFESLDNYRDAKQKILDCEEAIKELIYTQATTAYDKKDYSSAYSAFTQIKDYKDVSKYLSNSILSWFGKGNIVTFGKYEQDNNLSNGAEPLEWIVLDLQDDKAFVVSKYCIDAMPFNDIRVDNKLSWEDCTLRSWLNQDFYSSAFSDTEKQSIVTTNISNDSGLPDTFDSVFILSKPEIEKYFPTNKSRATLGTMYAKKSKKLYVNADTAVAAWWIRATTIVVGYGAASYFVSNGSSFNKPGNIDHGAVFWKTYGVRPAMYVNIETGK